MFLELPELPLCSEEERELELPEDELEELPLRSEVDCGVESSKASSLPVSVIHSFTNQSNM